MVKVKILKREALRVSLPSSRSPLKVSMGNFTILSPPDVEHYEGEYEITPQNTEQVLSTANKYMDADVAVKATPYHEVENLHGGTTAIIGG